MKTVQEKVAELSNAQSPFESWLQTLLETLSFDFGEARVNQQRLLTSADFTSSLKL